jgi:hypothetical protein
MTREFLQNILGKLSKRRPIFYSEADFQHELALQLNDASWRCRLEVPLSISLKGAPVKAEVDIMALDPGSQSRVAIELKYITAKLSAEHGGEAFQLANNWGTNLSRFDCLADWERVASIVAEGHAQRGFTVFLTNAGDAWTRDVSATDILARDMSTHEGRKLFENEELSWPEDLNPKSVGKKRLPPYSPILCPASLACGWSDYSVHDSARNAEFRYLLLEAKMKV